MQLRISEHLKDTEAYYPLGSMLQEIADSGSSVLIVGHLHPDGDSIGSIIATHELLVGLGADSDLIHTYCPEVPTYLKQFDTNNILSTEIPLDSIDIVVVVDAPGDVILSNQNSSDSPESNDSPESLVLSQAMSRLPSLENLRWRDGVSPLIVNIDHHDSNLSAPDHQFLVTTASSVAEMIWHAYNHLPRINSLDRERSFAEACYLGMVTDTNRFAFPNTSALTLQAAAGCLDAGARATDICVRLDTHSSAQIKMLSRCLTNISYHADGIVAAMLLDQDLFDSDMSSVSTQEALTLARSINGVKLAVSCIPRNDGWKFSLRTYLGYDVAAIARKYGGGGHQQASAFITSVDEDPSSTLADIIDCFMKQHENNFKDENNEIADALDDSDDADYMIN